jgi:hypothetical protein
MDIFARKYFILDYHILRTTAFNGGCFILRKSPTFIENFFFGKSRCQVATVVTIKNLITMPEYSIAEYADIYFV